MDRQRPRTTSDEIDLYIRTYYSLLRSSGEVWVRAFEEAHAFSDSSLHPGARTGVPDVAAFAYSAARLPACMPQVQKIVLGQSHETFEANGFDVSAWQRVQTRGRRRPLRFDGARTLCAFISSTSDIDDLVPIVTTYQIVWNQMHVLLGNAELGRRLREDDALTAEEVDHAELARVLDLDPDGVRTLIAALDSGWFAALRTIAQSPCDLSMRVLTGSYSQYQRSVQRWWSGIEPSLVRERKPRRPPIYFVSSNTHSLLNLVGGYARQHREAILDFARRRNPEDLARHFSRALEGGDEAEVNNLSYYLLRAFLHQDPSRLAEVQEFEAEAGITSIDVPGKIDVNAQIFDLSQVRPERLDPRVRVPDLHLLARSDAVILNIDYPLGMAAYHHLSRAGQGSNEIRGVYVMGKAATLNGRVGDVMISSVVQDEHSRNTYLFRNSFVAADVQPYIRVGTVLDNQKALTVRGAFLQNREYMSVFYREGYTVLEMEAGPYLSAVYELCNPQRHPNDEIVHLSNSVGFDVGVLHYASDTPYSRRQSLLSKSLSYFGVESTSACATAIVRRIFAAEIARLRAEEEST
ncbi:hypothetical protein OV079_32765 [Nannocystis pusilla]|uniref:Uncharacterized protein n=1 Tax=Nannocystis pusilla TaxID=889268 RepID=A0A9X3J139_9BACT|nr:hypothetical protein [Nannocystis pusilla]MCY1010259.1 hypothetical protein [Nannocystis pusilla]